MPPDHDPHIPNLIARIREGDARATSELIDVAYAELRGIAGRLFADQSSDHTLQPTALVNEVALRLLRSPGEGWNDEQHFFRAAARAMRHLLIDHARAKRSEKRGGARFRVSLEAIDDPAAPQEVDLVALDDTLAKLAKVDDRLAQIFELRFLVGLSVERTAGVMGVSPRTIELDTRLIRAWLSKELAATW